jgi:hypothetical protein
MEQSVPEIKPQRETSLKKGSSLGPTDKMWAALSPSNPDSQGQGTDGKTGDHIVPTVDINVDSDSEEPPRSKHRPVDRRFSDVQALDLRGRGRFKSVLEKDEDKNFQDLQEERVKQAQGRHAPPRRPSPAVNSDDETDAEVQLKEKSKKMGAGPQDRSAHKETKKNQTAQADDAEFDDDDMEEGSENEFNEADSDESESDDSNGDGEGTQDDEKWSRVAAMLNGETSLQDVISLSMMGDEPQGKQISASETLGNILNWGKHEAAFTRVRKNGVITSRQARQFMESLLGGDTSPVKDLRAAARTRGPVVNQAVKNILTWAGQHQVKTSSAVSIMIDAVSKQGEGKEPHQLRVDRAIEYFMRTQKGDWIEYLKNTSKGVTHKIRDQTLQDEPGLRMLQPTHKECEKAWTVLSMGVTSVLAYTPETMITWEVQYAEWLTVGRTMTVGMSKIEGKFAKQRKKEDIEDMHGRMQKQEMSLRSALRAAKMESDIPTGNQLVGNLIEAARPEYVKHVREYLRDQMSRKKGVKPMTLERAVRLLKDAEMRLSAKLLGDVTREESDRRTERNSKSTRRKADQDDAHLMKRTLTQDQMKAMRAYARVKDLKWRQVKLEDVESTSEGIQGWLKQFKEYDDSKAQDKPKEDKKSATEEKAAQTRVCRFYLKGDCRRGDQCNFKHEGTPKQEKEDPKAKAKKKPEVSHQRPDTEEESEDSHDDESEDYESHWLQTHVIEEDDETESSNESDEAWGTPGEHTDSEESTHGDKGATWIVNDHESTSSTESDDDDETDMTTLTWIRPENVIATKRRRIEARITPATEKTADDDHSTSVSSDEFYRAMEDDDLEDAVIASDSDESSDDPADFDMTVSEMMHEVRRQHRMTVAEREQATDQLRKRVLTAETKTTRQLSIREMLDRDMQCILKKQITMDPVRETSKTDEDTVQYSQYRAERAKQDTKPATAKPANTIQAAPRRQMSLTEILGQAERKAAAQAAIQEEWAAIHAAHLERMNAAKVADDVETEVERAESHLPLQKADAHLKHKEQSTKFQRMVQWRQEATARKTQRERDRQWRIDNISIPDRVESPTAQERARVTAWDKQVNRAVHARRYAVAKEEEDRVQRDTARAAEWADMRSLKKAMDDMRHQQQRCQCMDCDQDATVLLVNTGMSGEQETHLCQGCYPMCKCRCGGCANPVTDDEQDIIEAMVDWDLQSQVGTQAPAEGAQDEQVDFDIPKEAAKQQRMADNKAAKQQRMADRVVSTWKQNWREVIIYRVSGLFREVNWRPTDEAIEHDRIRLSENRRKEARLLHADLMRAESQMQIEGARHLKLCLEEAERLLCRGEVANSEKQEAVRRLHEMQLDKQPQWLGMHEQRLKAAAGIRIWLRNARRCEVRTCERREFEASVSTKTKLRQPGQKGWLKAKSAFKQALIQVYHAGVRKTRSFISHVEGQARTTGVDSYAEVSMILDTAVNPKWPVLEDDSINMKGIGRAQIGRLILVPVSYRCGLRAEHIEMRVATKQVMPRGIDILLGTDIQHKNDMTIKAGTDRLVIGTHSVVIDTERTEILTERRKSRPRKVLELAGGMSTAMLIMKDLGWRIGLWHTSEIDQSAMAVAEAVAARAGVTATHLGDLIELAETELETEYDDVFASPPCKQFSRAPESPKGWDSLDGSLFKACCTIIRKLRSKGQRPEVLFENVVLHEGRAQDAATQEDFLEMEFKNLRASDCGGTQQRERRIATDICDIGKLQYKGPADPNWMLHPTGRTDLRLMPCVMAIGSATKAPPMVVDAATGLMRYADINELERLQGYPDNITNAWGSVNSPKERGRLIGNSWNYHQMAAIMREKKPVGKRSVEVHAASEVDGVKMTDTEREWHTLSDEQQVQRLKKKLVGYTLPKHYVEVKEGENVPYQVPIRERARTTPAREPAARAELKLRLQRGHLKLVTYDRKFWISRMFTKGKDRVNPETGLEAIRFLTDLREVNKAIQWPKQWGDECPTIERVAETIPRSARFFASEDVKDAYEGCGMDKRSRHMVVAATPFEVWAHQFTDEELRMFSDEPLDKLRASDRPLLVQWQGMPQGLASAAPFYNVHLADGLNQLFGESWRGWWSIYVDDILVHGSTYAHCALRQRLIQNALRALGKELSAKCDRSIREYGKIVGLKITSRGIEPDDDVMTTLYEELKRVPKTRKQAMHLIGVIRYSHTAFRWGADDLLWFNTAMAPMHGAVARDKYEWDERCTQGVQMLQQRMQQMPRAHTNPEELLDANHCLVVISDASDEGVGAGLWSVMKPDAREVTMDDLHDPEISTLMAIDSKILDKSQQRWATFEKETYGAYRAMKKWGRLMVQAIQKYPDSKVKKISLRMDNSTATKQWLEMHNPGMIDYAGPKQMRFLAWAEDMAFTREIPMDVSFIPGNMNSLADMVSRIADKLGDAAKRKKQTEHDVIVAHAELYTTDAGEMQHVGEIPEGFKTRHLHMTRDDADEVRRAQLVDPETVHHVTLGDVARCVLNNGVGVTPEISQKIMPWIGRTYFRITHPGTKVELMYTPVSQTRVHWETEDATKVLVLQVPNDARVKLTSADELFDAEALVEDTPDWITRQFTLKGQLLSMCHDMIVPHPSQQESMAMLKRIAHWSKQLRDLQEHIKYCADCLEAARHREEAGTGIVAKGRLKVTQMDHYILEKERALLCGVAMILTLTDVATRITSYEIAKQQTALETAKILYKRWIPYYGIPDMIISDPHPGFASEVMNHLRQILGIRERMLAASGSKAKTAMVESRHNELSAALSDGFARGNIRTQDDVEMYLATAKRRHDQEGAASTTPFECLTGQKPAGRMNMALLKEAPAEVQKVMGEEELQFCERIKQHTEQLMDVNLWERDNVARNNTRRRHQENARAPKHTHFDMKEGDQVSYQGKLFVLGKSTGSAENKPITSEILDKKGNAKRVQYKDLKPAATPRPGNYLPREPPATGAFVMWDGEHHLRTGVVIGSARGRVTAHEHQGTEGTALYWLPLWKTPEGGVKKAKVAPAGGTPVQVVVSVNAIRLVGKLTETMAMTQSTKKEARAKSLL